LRPAYKEENFSHLHEPRLKGMRPMRKTVVLAKINDLSPAGYVSPTIWSIPHDRPSLDFPHRSEARFAFSPGQACGRFEFHGADRIMRLPLWAMRLMHRSRLSRSRLKGGWIHSRLGDRILDKKLWSPTRESLARAWLVGFPITVMPFLPAQSLFAVIAALCVRGNLLLCIALQFLSTPLTAPVHLPACYFVGELVRGTNPAAVWRHISTAPRDLFTREGVISLYLGAFVIGIIGGCLGYAIIIKTWRDRIRPPRPIYIPPGGVSAENRPDL